MLKCLREKHPYLYCALAVVLFMAVMMAGQFLFSVAVVLLGPAGLIQLFDSEPYLLQAVSELFALLAPLFLLWRTGPSGCSHGGAPVFWTACWWACSPLCSCA